MRGEILKGHLDLLLLATLTDEPLHGYRIIEQLQRRSGGAFNLPQGTVYPALYRLEKVGLLSSRWTTVNGRRRRVYRLTAKGREALRSRHEEWKRLQAGVTSVLEGVK